MSSLPTIKLKKGKDIPIKAGHPWIFSNAIENCPNIKIGEFVQILSFENAKLGLGMFNPNNSIRVRVISKDPNEIIDQSFFEKCLKNLYESKSKLLPKDTNAFRLAYADSDYLPGLIIDKFDEVFVFQINTAGMENFRNEIIEAIKKIFNPKTIIERSDLESRKMEGLKILEPKIHHQIPPLFQERGLGGEFSENGIKFYADVLNGQKTGFFLDQRDARKKTLELAKDKNVLNLFSYTGAFSLYAIKGGAKSVSSVDISEKALNLAKENFKLNDLNPEDKKYEFIKEDVFKFLNSQFSALSSKNYDLLICDPPALTKSGSNTRNALKAYTDLNQKCLEMLNKGGILITSSCSGRITEDDFRHALKIATFKAGKDVKILNILGASFDHTDKLSFPEGKYLKTFVLEVI
ncbi:MAG: hypothetical protein UR28_C0031G0002 [Candidatus Peregrinibacteria bacterium GW2011_GWF2_33_10]|nr:MAG: hypothetical protein UR28_C0031G0002 [Candidatus Peregrinibacteria bacterium GW2011_GWF2_33_10]OGJ44645.1 MAG: hypothetical protein A2263_00180 [Candidatus Peregrinibacteria bacterium RIFOXYA2_FULL_33_21]OGJ46409.1 MAG: hypothetical protein A2272_06565 [Candidatus Peregrinibacteria bacterium RIFOXYA12_FULL_33_12]